MAHIDVMSNGHGDFEVVVGLSNRVAVVAVHSAASFGAQRLCVNPRQAACHCLLFGPECHVCHSVLFLVVAV